METWEGAESEQLILEEGLQPNPVIMGNHSYHYHSFITMVHYYHDDEKSIKQYFHRKMIHDNI